MFSWRDDGCSDGLWARIALLFVSLLLTAGCGSSNDADGVVGTTLPASASETGDLTFRFIQAQVALEVPGESAKLRFEFFRELNGTGSTTLSAQVVDLAPEVTVRGVPVTTRSVVVTVLDRNNVPLLRSTLTVTVSPGFNKYLEFAQATTESITLSSLSLSPTEALLEPGHRQQFLATATYSNGDVLPASGVTWSSTQPEVASVEFNGLVTARSDGTTTVSVTSGNIRGTATVEVLTPVATSLSLTPQGDEVGRGTLKQYRLTGSDQLGRPLDLNRRSVRWDASPHFEITSSSNISLLVRAVSTGPAEVTVSVDGISATADASIIEPNIDGLVSVNLDPVALTVNPTVTSVLTTLGRFGNAPPRPLTVANDGLSYVVADLEVVHVSNDGLVTPLAVGQTTITAHAGSFSLSTQVTVSNSAGNQPPQVSFDTHQFSVHQEQEGVPAFSHVSVTDDQANLAGGKLQIATEGSNPEVVLDSTSGVAIGQVSGDGTASITVLLDEEATPARIRDFLAGVELSSPAGSRLGLGALRVGLSDGMSGDNSGSEPTVSYLVLGQGAGMYRVPADYASVTQAIDAIATSGEPGSAILVAEGVHDAVVAIGSETADMPRLHRLQILGNNAGITAGALPFGHISPTRRSETVIPRFSAVWVPGVTLDGLKITGAADHPGLVVTPQGSGLTVKNSVFEPVLGATRGFELPSNSPTHDLTIESCSFRNWNVAVFLAGATGRILSSNHRIVSNVFDSNGTAVHHHFPDGGKVESNSFQRNGTHLLIQYYFEWNTTAVSYNDFDGSHFVLIQPPDGIGFSRNYWGPDGPPGDGDLSYPEPSESPWTNYGPD